MKDQRADILAALKALPPLYATDGDTRADTREAVYLFTPDAGATWVLWEYDPEQRLAFGLCDLGLGFPEIGYVSIDEVFATRGRFRLPVEWDRSNRTVADGYRNAGVELPDYLR